MQHPLPPYEVLFKKYWKEIFYFCRKRLSGDEDAAKDIAEESFIKAWNAYHKFQSEENAKAFIYIVAKNACVNALQALRRHNKVDIDLPIFELLIYDGTEQDVFIIESEVIAFIHREIKKMPKGMREAIELLMAGYNSTEAAKRSGISRKTILNQKLKAIAHLRKRVKLKFDI